jgi:tRNA (cmo5U34)-methyltransferase
MADRHSLPKYVGPEVSLAGQKMSQQEIQARFDAETAAAYSQRKPLWLPEHDYAMRLVLKALKSYLPDSARLVDLGAGTGNLSRRVLKALPDCHVTLVDFSQNMLNEAPRLLAAFDGRYRIMLEDFWRMEFPPGEYDGVVASFALHHGRGEAVYWDLYRKIYDWLKVPGVFVCCDVVQGDAPPLAEMNEAGWRGFLQKRDFAPEDIERIFSNYRREDSPLSLRQHLDLLMQAGFGAADVLWKRFNFAVYVGIKS